MKRLVALLLLAFASPALTSGARGDGEGPAAVTGTTAAAARLSRIPLLFEDVPGAPDDGRFVARTTRYTLRLAHTSMEIAPVPADGAGARTPVVMRFAGARPGPREVAVVRGTGTVSYLVGDAPAAWRTGAPTFTRVRYSELYPGIDIAYYGTDREVEYDLILAPGSDPATIRMAFDAGTPALLESGDLEIGGGVPLRLRAPVAYQLIEGRRVEVRSRYALHDDGTVGFVVGSYDRRRELVIDPILSYSVSLGGQGLDEAAAVAVDAAGNVYLAGTTASADFPGATGPGGGLDVFVTKLDPRGVNVLFSAYVGGSGVDEALGLAIDAEGHAYVVGSTTSTNFPTRMARQGSLAGSADAFVFKLSTTGAGLIFSTYHGGSGTDEAHAVAVDPQRNVYVAGGTRSADLPVLAQIQGFRGNLDGFVAKLTATGSLAWSTFHGGSGTDVLNAIGVDAGGNPTVAGTTTSTDLPVTSAARPTNAGMGDALISRFSTAGALVFCTYYGGEGPDVAQAVAVNASGYSFVGGSTASAAFPTVAPVQPTLGGSLDAFLMALSPGGTVAWATYYGGTRSERGRAVALNARGQLALAGQTFSSDLPVLRAAQARTGGNRDTFVVQLEYPYNAFNYATYLGGSNNDEGTAAAIDAVGRVLVAGSAAYPSPGARGASDAFVYGLSTGSAGVDTDGDGLPDDWETQFDLDPVVDDAGADPDGDGHTNAQELALGTHPTGYYTRYLAEGATGSFFDDRIALFNPGAAMATVLLRFQREGDVPEIQQLIALAGHSRLTLEPETLAGLESASFSTVIESDQPVVVDRTMTWDSRGFGSHAETSIEQVATEWFLAEGATGGTFELFYLLQNPTTQAASVTITYLRPSDPPLTKSYTVGPRSRMTINVDNERGFTGRPADERSLRDTDVSARIVSTNGVPILVERAMYMTAGGRVFAAGHNSAGITTPATSWFLAEGATGYYFDLFILLANPTMTATNVEVRYLLQGGAPVTRTYELPAQSRRTIYVDADPALTDVATSAIVRSLNGVPIVVERAMWWPGGGWTEAHNSAGAIVTSSRWALAEGEIGGTTARQTYVLLANTSNVDGRVRVSVFFEDQGEPLVQEHTVPAQRRFNVELADTIAQGRRFSVLVEGLGATPPQLVVERAMYSNSGSVFWAAGTNALGTPLFPPDTLTVTPNGVFPKVLVVDEGARVRIVNQDPTGFSTLDCAEGGHDISDDPHPTHGDSPEFGAGRLDFGGSRLTQNLVTLGSFGVHDHCHGADTRWNARIVVRPR